MAKLFLSYSRKDALRAQRLTEWLERHDHDVWRDEDDIRGGASFSNEIEQALEDCDAVVVLWSAESVKSPWVRDEAGYGRDNSKLIPLTLDGTLPPLGFRQFQSIDLTKWKGKGDPSRAEQILRAIRTTGNTPGRGRADFAPKAIRRSRTTTPRVAILATILALVIVGASVIAWRTLGQDSNLVIAVAPSPTSPDKVAATDYANLSAADMASFLPTHFDRVAVIAPDASPSGAAYRVLISANRHGPGADASLTLSDMDGHTTLWSKSWNVPDASAVDLRQQVSRSASQAALCLTDARGGQERLVQPALALYLAGCIGISDSGWSDEALLAQFEKVVRLAPKFSRGWDYLAIGRSVIAATQQENRGSPDSAAIKSAQAAIAAARRLNPQSGLPYMAEAILLPDDYLKGLALLERGAALEPSNALLQSELTSYLQAVGRMTDAVATAQRAVELDPLSSLVRANYIIALTYAGQFSRVRTDIAEARKKWPSDPQIDFAEFGFHYRYGDPATAEKLLPRALPYSDARLLSYRKILAARLDPTPAKIEDAINAWNRPDDPKRLNQYLLALGLFGKVDEVYALLAQPRFRPVADPDILFRPEFAAVRADRRFIPVAARLGLTAYWSKSGIWPDFCSAERLPYDCKKEAAKYR